MTELDILKLIDKIESRKGLLGNVSFNFVKDTLLKEFGIKDKTYRLRICVKGTVSEGMIDRFMDGVIKPEVSIYNLKINKVEDRVYLVEGRDLRILQSIKKSINGMGFSSSYLWGGHRGDATVICVLEEE